MSGTAPVAVDTKSRAGIVAQTVHFMWRQMNDLRKGGLPVLLRKSVDVLGISLAVLPVLVVIGLRPLILIRFGYLISSRIGHLARNTELYACGRDLNTDSRRTVDIFFHAPPICNQQLKKMWDRTLSVSPLAKWPFRLLYRLPVLKDHIVTLPSDRDTDATFAQTQAHISFTPEEEILGSAALREFGLPEGAPFVCFHARDSSYLNTIFPGTDWRYHDHQDANIHNYVPAMEELARRDHFAFRMGAIVKDALNSNNPRIIDYAAHGRTDFLDLYLSANCRFFLCSSSGLEAVPTIFRRPLVMVNLTPLEYAPSWGPDDLFIPKKLWLREEHRFLTFPEIMGSGIGRFLDGDQYEDIGVDVIENDPEDITALVVEMDERLNGTWETSNEDEELQRRFWSLFKPNYIHGQLLSRIGAEFLRQNRGLLD